MKRKNASYLAAQLKSFMASPEGREALELLSATKSFIVLAANDLESGFVDVCLLGPWGLGEIKQADGLWASLAGDIRLKAEPQVSKVGAVEAALAINNCRPHLLDQAIPALKEKLTGLRAQFGQRACIAIPLF